MDNFYVYLHRRVLDNSVFYVGKGKDKRAWSKQGRSEYWKRIVNKHGYIVHIVQSNLPNKIALEYEIEMIRHYGRQNLCNMTDGGEGIANPSLETRRKLSIAHLGKPKTPEAIQKTRLAHIGKIVGKETREKIAAIQLGRPRTEYTKNKISTSMLGLPKTLETRQKMKLAQNKVKATPLICSNGMHFSSQLDAVNWLAINGFPNASQGNIGMCANGKRKIAYGLTWRKLS